MSRNYCELELRIDWIDRGRYFLSARFIDPLSDTENQLLEPLEIKIDLDALEQNALDTKRYGECLTEMVFGDAVRSAYEHARVGAATRDGLRIRLTIQTTAPELHTVHWESLLDPRDGSRLLLQEDVLFSRFLSAQDFRLRPLPEAGELQALVVIANPSDLETSWRPLKAINKADELRRAVSALEKGGESGGHSIQHRTLNKAASIYNIITELRERYTDILYLVCHGAMTGEGKPFLLLEKDDGTAQVAEGIELVERLRDISQRPRLVVLASCEGAGDGYGQVLGAIGPRLAASGVPGVVAMQGKITMASVERFMPRLFEELTKEGQIDRAMAIARSEIRDQPDWWIPVLFMRLKTGRLWPRSSVDIGSFEKWDALARDIASNRCVPVLGPALVESALGSVRDIARNWAERYEFPLAPHDRDDLAQVAQYLVYRQSKSLVVDELREHLSAHIRARYPEELKEIGRKVGKDLLGGPVEPGIVDELISEIGRNQRKRDPYEVHRLLAKLPMRVFVNANRDNLLREALKAEGKTPRVRLCPWIMKGDAPVQIGPRLAKDYVPTVAEPLIFHVFGNMEYPESLVLTEDDYFDFLIAVTRNESLKKLSIPSAVSSALASSGLLLLGFQPDDWDFRVLFRGILKQPGTPLGDMCARVAVQVSPTEGHMIDPDRASQYLQTYFEKQGEINIFWGSADEFMRKLADRCATRGIIRLDG